MVESFMQEAFINGIFVSFWWNTETDSITVKFRQKIFDENDKLIMEEGLILSVRKEDLEEVKEGESYPEYKLEQIK
jgi:hypothetical protein